MPPDESPYLHTKFHFEFHSFKEETLFIATPQSHFVRQLPGRGAFWCGTNSVHSAVPLRGAIVSMGLRGVQGGLRGEIEIFPGPPAKKIIKKLIFYLFV